MQPWESLQRHGCSFNQQRSGATAGIRQRAGSIPASESDQTGCQVFLQRSSANSGPVSPAVQAATAAIQAEHCFTTMQVNMQTEIGFIQIDG